MIDGKHRYRIRGRRGTSAYLGFQVLAGSGLTPRRMAAHVSDRALAIADDGSFTIVVATTEPTAAELERRALAAGPRRRLGHRRARVHRRPRRRGAGRPRDRAARPGTPSPAAHRRLARRPADRDGVVDRQAHDAAQDDQARAARPAQRARHGRGRRPRRRRDHARQPLHAGHVPAGTGRGPRHRARAAGHPVLERDRREHLARVHRRPPAPQLDHERGRGRGRRRQGPHRGRRARPRDRPTGSTPAGAIGGS